MKKLFLLFTVVSLMFAGCSKSDDIIDEFSLSGKTYAAYAYQGGGFFGSDNYDVYWVYKFISENKVESTSRQVSPKGGIIGEIDIYTYSLNYPTLKIYREDGTITTATFIDENTFRTGSGSNVKEYIMQ